MNSHARWCLAAIMSLAVASQSALSQVPAPPQRFTIGGRDIVKLDFASTRVGDFPTGIEMVDGIMDVVAKNGQNMLRASSRSVFRVQLPQVLPPDFTLEFEIIPKIGGNPEDLAIEGTPIINQGANSANVMWHRDYLQIVGGGASYDSKVPPSFAATLPAKQVQVVLAMQGETMRLFTNGRLMYTQSNRKFVRGRVLRVFLGGQDDGPNAVYLASMRVVDGVPVAPVLAGDTPPGANPTGARPGTPPAPPPGASTTTRPGSTGAAPSRAPMTAPASPYFATSITTPVTTQFTFEIVPSAVGYRIRRAIVGTTDWTEVTPTPIRAPEQGPLGPNPRFTPNFVETFPNPRQTYIYELHALQVDGSYGTTPLTFTPPAPTDPTEFTAKATGPGEVTFTWMPKWYEKSFLLSGAGTGVGITVFGGSHKLTGVPAGTHTWTIATNYSPGGVLTSESAWPKASAKIIP